jgi:hypothetical protein
LTLTSWTRERHGRLYRWLENWQGNCTLSRQPWLERPFFQ